MNLVINFTYMTANIFLKLFIVYNSCCRSQYYNYIPGKTLTQTINITIYYFVFQK